MPIPSLFASATIAGIALNNRLVMAPMTRRMSPGGVPGPEVAAYYRRRAEGGVGLIITEGTGIADPAALAEANVPEFHGASLGGWAQVVAEVQAGGRGYSRSSGMSVARDVRRRLRGPTSPPSPPRACSPPTSPMARP